MSLIVRSNTSLDGAAIFLVRFECSLPDARATAGGDGMSTRGGPPKRGEGFGTKTTANAHGVEGGGNDDDDERIRALTRGKATN